MFIVHGWPKFTGTRGMAAVVALAFAIPGPCFELLGKKWTVLLVRALLDGPLRFTELLEAAPGLSDRVLSQRLKELEAARIVTRAQYAEVLPGSSTSSRGAAGSSCR